MRILIVKLSAIGDCLLATPVAQALRQSFPDAHIGWAVHDHCAPVIAGNPHLNRVHRLPRKKLFNHVVKFREELKAERYEIALDLQGLFKSGLVARLSGAKRRVGPAEAREKANLFYTEQVARGLAEKEHVVPGYLRLAAALGAEWAEEPGMHLPYTDADVTHARNLLGDRAGDKLIVLNPSAGKAIKQWSPKQFAAVGEMLADDPTHHLVITGAPSDRPLADELLSHFGPKSRVTDLTGKTNLNQLAALLSQVDLFIGGDTGPMHIAQAAGTRVLAIFGPTDPTVLGPRHAKHRIAYLGLECSPCRHRVCPIGRVCLEKLEAKQVAEMARQMLTSEA